MTQWDNRNLLGQGGPSKQRAGKVLGDRLGDRPADQIQLTDELNAFLCLVIELEHEAKDVAGIDEAYDDDISGIRNLVLEEHVADARVDELKRSAFGSLVSSQRPEVAVVVFQDLLFNQAIQTHINDRLRKGRQPFDPVLGVPLNWFAGNFLQNGVRGGVARFSLVQQEQGFEIRIDARYE